ncbi:HvfA family oxazolone/thioamide-modified RiPP metallophore, partial [Shewanella marina]|uniref:HvfA family oxazolone/thioamide-modified RiPP metallophore n=1 Tax=Shewanella marina TaxID=487319 RepID=UPI000470E2DA
MSVMKKTAVMSALGAVVVGSALTMPVEAQPFAFAEMSAGYQVSTLEGKCGEGKCGESKGKEGKCGEGKCGGEMKDKMNKAKEGKCGEGKCGGEMKDKM